MQNDPVRRHPLDQVILSEAVILSGAKDLVSDLPESIDKSAGPGENRHNREGSGNQDIQASTLNS